MNRLYTGQNNIDYHYANFIISLAGDKDNESNFDLLWCIAFLLSNKVSTGDICIYLKQIAGSEFFDNLQIVDEKLNDVKSSFAFPDYEILAAELARYKIIGKPGEFHPIILDDSGRLYMHKYYQYETMIVRSLTDLLEKKTMAIDIDIAREIILRLFEGSDDSQINWQMIGTALALNRQFTVITGGPGTGKTTTAARIMAALIEIYQRSGMNADIAVCAPTGKAARRLRESIMHQKHRLNTSDDIKNAIPNEAMTIHRMLGAKWLSNKFRHNKDNPLPFNIIIADECSMIDMPMFAKLLDAMADDARLIMLGDKDQLASVEAGHIFGDLCGNDISIDKSSSQSIKDLTNYDIEPSTKASSLQSSIAYLKKNWRFKGGGDIGKLANAIKDGGDVLHILKSDEYPNIRFWDNIDSNRILEFMAKRYGDNYLDMCRKNKLDEAAAEIDNFTILCALRKGPYGAEWIGNRIEQFIKEKMGISTGHSYFNGMPVMILENDNTRKLYNGDIGLIKPVQMDTEKTNLIPEDKLRFYIKSDNENFKQFFVHQLPSHSAVYAMTIHKSQGSEFKNVAIVLPDKPSPILTKELFYTAISRARESVDIIGKADIIEYIMSQEIHRDSGLKDRLGKL